MNLTNTVQQAIIEAQLSEWETKVQAWVTDGSALGTYPDLDLLFIHDDLSDQLHSLRRRAKLLDLRVTAQGMAIYHRLTAETRRNLSRWVALDKAGLTFVQDPTLAYAFLSCAFTTVRMDFSAADAQCFNEFFHRWLPDTRDYALTVDSTTNMVADMIFDPAWLTLYDIDFDSLGAAGRDTLLLTQPPLRGLSFALTPDTQTNKRELPGDLTV